MDIMWIAILVDMTIYGLAGFAIVKFGGRLLPDPWNRIRFTVPVVLMLGALVTLVSFPHWIVFPK